MLSKLKQLHERQGWLSGVLINEAENMPSSTAYAHRFGGLVAAYKLIGYDPGIDYSYQEINKHLRRMYPQIVEDAIRRIKEMGGAVYREVTNDLLTINDEIKVSIVISRCFQTQAGANRWKIRLDTGLLPDITIVIRMDAANQEVKDYYLLPAIDIENPQIRLADDNHLALDAYRFDDLEMFFMLTERVKLERAA